MFRPDARQEAEDLIRQYLAFGREPGEGSLIFGLPSGLGMMEFLGEALHLTHNILQTLVLFCRAGRGDIDLFCTVNELGSEINKLHNGRC